MAMCKRQLEYRIKLSSKYKKLLFTWREALPSSSSYKFDILVAWMLIF